jgi:hypothetical protein
LLHSSYLFEAADNNTLVEVFSEAFKNRGLVLVPIPSDVKLKEPRHVDEVGENPLHLCAGADLLRCQVGWMDINSDCINMPVAYVVVPCLRLCHGSGEEWFYGLVVCVLNV